MPRSTRGRSEGSWELCTDVISAGGSRRPKHWRSTLCPVCVVCVCVVCVCLYERGHSSLNGPLLQAAISLEPPRPPHDFLRYSLRKDREGQTLSIPLCFFLTVFSAHDSRALWVISTLQHPSQPYEPSSAASFMLFVLLPVSARLTLFRDRITGNSREVPVGPPIMHPTRRNPSQSGSICDLRESSFWVCLVFIPRPRI